MEIKNALILESEESLSKAMNEILKSGTAVIITKDGRYYGIIDDRHIKSGIQDMSKIKCDNISVKAPQLTLNSSILERLNSFLAGHFKALPVVNENGKPIGIYSRSDLLSELLSLHAYTDDTVKDLMNVPVYTIDHEENLGSVKKKMKEKNSSRLLVTKDGYPFGVVSSFDLAALEVINPLQGKDYMSPRKQTRPINETPISEFLRERLALLPATVKIQDAIKKMSDMNVSSVVICNEQKKPIGVLSATDIFKKLVEIVSQGPEVIISGLSEDDLSYYDYVKDSINKVIKKFSKSFTIDTINIHLKKGKSIYNINLHFNLNSAPVSISVEDFNIKSALDKLCNEFYTILHKKKEKSSSRHSSSGGED